MPKKIPPLTDAKIRATTAVEKDVTLFDGDGLYLLIKPSGSKLWRFKYQYLGKSRLLGMGGYPEVSLKLARERKLEARRQIESGLDPSEQRKEVRKAATKVVMTFKALFDDWLNHKTTHLAESTRAKIENSMVGHAIPKLGGMPVEAIRPEDVLACIREIEAQGALEMARRVRAWISRVFRFGMQTGQCPHDPAAILRGALKTPIVKHHAALPVDQLPDFLAALDDPLVRLYPLTRLGLKLIVLTAVRPGELRFAEWNEIDFEKSEWRIPASRMKMRHEHVVPLSRQAAAVINQIKLFSAHERYLLPAQGSSNGVISENTLGKAAKSLGFAVTAHGFRSTFSTYLNESELWSSDAIEAQLAHKPTDAVRSAYYRGNRRLEERRRLMQWWADELDRLRTNRPPSPAP